MELFIPHSDVIPKDQPKFSQTTAKAVKEKKSAYKKYKNYKIEYADIDEIPRSAIEKDL